MAARFGDVTRLLGSLGQSDTSRQLSLVAEGLEDPALRVVVFGEFNRGKSTLINGLLGRFVLPAKLVPTTGHITRLIHGTSEQVRVRMLDGQSLTCPLDQLGAFSTLSRDGIAREDVEDVEVAVDAPLLKDGLVLIDTPGVNEADAQTRRARNAIALADLVLLVLDARQLLGDHEQTLAVDWLTHKLGKPLLLIVNFMNLVEERERPGLRERLDRWCRTHLRVVSGRAWFEVNALGALAHALGRRPATGDDFGILQAYLLSCHGDQRRSLQQSRIRQLLADVREITTCNEQALSDLNNDLDRVALARQQTREDLGRLSARLDAEGRVERERLLAVARDTLRDSLASLIAICLVDRDRSILEAHAVEWYRDYLSQAVQNVERRAAEVLHYLSGEQLSRPELLTIRERMMLNARPLVPMIDPTDSDMAFRISVGEAIGTFVLPLPLVGDAVGRRLHDWLGHYLSFKPCSYTDACIEQARTRWQADAADVLAILQEQFDLRLAALQRELADKRTLAETPLAAATELAERQELQTLLADCERNLLQWQANERRVLSPP